MSGSASLQLRSGVAGGEGGGLAGGEEGGDPNLTGHCGLYVA
jgi:hypothetical protein